MFRSPAPYKIYPILQNVTGILICVLFCVGHLHAVDLTGRDEAPAHLFRLPLPRRHQRPSENRRLEKALELEKLRAKAYDTMINVAEETFNIPIRKKSGTKQ